MQAVLGSMRERRKTKGQTEKTSIKETNLQLVLSLVSLTVAKELTREQHLYLLYKE